MQPGAIIGITIAIALLILLIYFMLEAQQARSETRLPPGRILYADQGVTHESPATLYANSIRLKGRPDYLIQTAGGSIIPVELKSAKSPLEFPYEAHVMQLAAYCLLVDENYGIRPTHGIIQYQDNAWTIQYDDELEAELLRLLASMHADRLAPNVNRSHAFPKRCAACGVRSECSQALAG